MFPNSLRSVGRVNQPPVILHDETTNGAAPSCHPGRRVRYHRGLGWGEYLRGGSGAREPGTEVAGSVWSLQGENGCSSPYGTFSESPPQGLGPIAIFDPPKFGGIRPQFRGGWGGMRNSRFRPEFGLFLMFRGIRRIRPVSAVFLPNPGNTLFCTFFANSRGSRETPRNVEFRPQFRGGTPAPYMFFIRSWTRFARPKKTRCESNF